MGPEGPAFSNRPCGTVVAGGEGSCAPVNGTGQQPIQTKANSIAWPPGGGLRAWPLRAVASVGDFPDARRKMSIVFNSSRDSRCGQESQRV